MVACVLTPRVAAREEHVHVEELEVDAGILTRPAVRRFLRDCAVPADAIARALRVAADTAGSAGTALLRVDVAPDGSTVSISGTGPPASHAGAGTVEDALMPAARGQLSDPLSARALA
jgi:hypothetical protein